MTFFKLVVIKFSSIVTKQGKNKASTSLLMPFLMKIQNKFKKNEKKMKSSFKNSHFLPS